MKHPIEWLSIHPFAGIPDTAKVTASCAKEVYALIEASGYRGTKLLILKTIQGLSQPSTKSDIYSYEPGYSWSSKTRLAEMMGVSKRQMERHLSDLLEDGVLIRGLRMGHIKQNFYCVNFAVIEKSNRTLVREKEARRKPRKQPRTESKVSPNQVHNTDSPHGANTAIPTALTPMEAAATTPYLPTATTPYPPTALTPPNNSRTVVGPKSGQQLPVSATPPKPEAVVERKAEGKGEKPIPSVALMPIKFRTWDQPSNSQEQKQQQKQNLVAEAKPVYSSPYRHSRYLQQEFIAWQFGRENKGMPSGTREQFDALYRAWQEDNPLRPTGDFNAFSYEQELLQLG